ncbi:unnamed protein product [Anisakis simplex]|uniref:Uncharacterized protein n=1 Tax=Anisakis simplex TaxID=6269 RepID=A0A0M3J4A5_ANISI|nr:unnamed protein product [Anisakis simplex]
MSAGSFAIGNEKRRVAHRTTASSVDLIRELAFKRQSLSKMVNQMSSKKTDKSTKKENRFLNGVKAHKKHNTASYSRKKISSDDEDEDDLALNGDDYDSKDELKLSDDEEKPQRNGSKRSPLPPAPVPTSSTLPSVSSEPSFEQRQMISL